MDTCIMDISAWVTRPERPKGAKDEVKEGRRALLFKLLDFLKQHGFFKVATWIFKVVKCFYFKVSSLYFLPFATPNQAEV